ncbi:MAG TPA: hypothetical protein VMH83_00175 [Candidatus Acidoferrum sp.]|nr:hypothetical protein [Candidatus Acidoferrum sp.]
MPNNDKTALIPAIGPQSRLGALIATLQVSPARLRWAYADEALLRSIARRQPLRRGERGRWLYRALMVADCIGCEWLLLLLISWLRVCLLHLRTLPRTTNDISVATHVFVGFGAGAEEELSRRFAAETGGKVTRLNQTDLRTFAAALPVGYSEHVASLWDAFSQARQALAQLPPQLQAWRLDFLRFVGTRVVDYAYFRVWFGKFAGRNAGGRLATLTPDTAAFAACDQGLRCLFVQHGLVFHLLLPDFTEVQALTEDEARWFARVLPMAGVSVHANVPMLPVEQLQPKLLVASIYGEASFLARMLPLLAWARERGMPLVVRPHPREDHDFWRSGTGMEAQQPELDTTRESFIAMLARIRPRLVVSWYSTTLAEALQAGVIPVTVCALDDVNVADMVYPLWQRALQWPRDADSIERLMTDDAFYRDELARLRQYDGREQR